MWHTKCQSANLVNPMDPHNEGAPKTMDHLADIPVVVEAHFEERMMDLRDILAIRHGIVIPLNRPAGETLRVYAGNVFLASAEVIVIEDHLALRITEFERTDA